MKEQKTKTSPKIEMLVLSIATSQFTVPLPTGKEVIRAVNSHEALVEALQQVVDAGWNSDWIIKAQQNARRVLGDIEK